VTVFAGATAATKLAPVAEYDEVLGNPLAADGWGYRWCAVADGAAETSLCAHRPLPASRTLGPIRWRVISPTGLAAPADGPGPIHVVSGDRASMATLDPLGENLAQLERGRVRVLSREAPEGFSLVAIDARMRALGTADAPDACREIVRWSEDQGWRRLPVGPALAGD
jgi:hypothetical protein